MAAGPLLSPKDFLVFEGEKIPGVIPDQLCYFGASIFWRGGAHDWKFQRQTSDRLPLGPYQESLRLFLLGGAWPAAATLQVFVGANMSEMRNNTAMPAYERYRIPEGRCYCFTVPGLTYFLWLGKGTLMRFVVTAVFSRYSITSSWSTRSISVMCRET